MRMTSKNICNYGKISCIDYSNYDPARCNNGGCYAEGEILYNNGNGTFTVVPYTSGEYCPKCGSWDCSGGCCEDEIVSAISALFIIGAYNGNECEITFA